MSDFYVPIRGTLFQHPKVLAMAARLKTNPAQVIGYLAAVWNLEMRHGKTRGQDGVIPYYTAEMIDAMTCKGLTAAAAEIKWIVPGDNMVTLPNIRNQQDNIEDLRAGYRKKKQAQRSKSTIVSEVSPETSRGPLSGDLDVRRKTETKTKGKKTSAASPQLFGEPEPEPAQPAELAFPPELDTPAFRAAWDEYTTYRRERNLSKLQARSVASKFAEFAKLGEPAALESIRQTIANGWTGTFAPKTFQGAAGTRGDPLASARLRRASTAQGEYATPIEVREI
jgi:hypothetical protein